MEVFLERLRELTEEKTQKQLALETGIPQQTLSRYLAGKQKPDIERLLILCRCLKTTPNYLLGVDD